MFTSSLKGETVIILYFTFYISLHKKNIDCSLDYLQAAVAQCLLSSDATADNTNDRIKVRMRSVHCCTPQLEKLSCRKVVKSLKNLGNIHLVISIRPDYR